MEEKDVVDVKIRLERAKKDKLAILARIHGQSMTRFVCDLIDTAISESKELQALEKVQSEITE